MKKLLLILSMFLLTNISLASLWNEAILKADGVSKISIDYYGPSIYIPNIVVLIMAILAIVLLSLFYIKNESIFSRIVYYISAILITISIYLIANVYFDRIIGLIIYVANMMLLFIINLKRKKSRKIEIIKYLKNNKLISLISLIATIPITLKIIIFHVIIGERIDNVLYREDWIIFCIILMVVTTVNMILSKK